MLAAEPPLLPNKIKIRTWFPVCRVGPVRAVMPKPAVMALAPPAVALAMACSAVLGLELSLQADLCL